MALMLVSIIPCLYADNDPDVIEFAMITDTHRYGPSADIRYAEANINAFIEYCNHTPSLSFALHGGDLMNAYDTNHEQALWCLEHGQRDFIDLKIPMYVTKGNHDCNGKCRTKDRRPDNSQIITDHEFYRLFSPLSDSNPLAGPDSIVIDPANPEGNYYYRDFTPQRFRLIVLNAYDQDSMEVSGYHGQQVKWLAETALNFEDKEDAENWCFLMVGHTFSVNMKDHATSRLMHAYIHGQPFTDSDNGVTYGGQFNKMKRATMVGLLGGHVHEDIYRWSQNYNMIHVTRGFATGGEVGRPDQDICFSHFKLNTRTHTLEEKRIGRGSSRLFSYGQQHTMLAPVGTFPEADGMGMYTQGGTGGEVYIVNNLKDSGRGSLRWAVEQEGCRTIVFEVSGNIQLKSPLVIKNDSISILGHSAPGQGIYISGAPVQILASEVIMRYIHLRGVGITDGDFGQSHIMLDHLSVCGTTGNCISIRRAKGVSVQNCILSHTLLSPMPADGKQPAALMAGGFMATYHHNLIANSANAVEFPSEEGENRWIHFARNIVYNWRDHAMWGGGRQGEISIEENYLIPGAATLNNQMLDVAPDGTGRYYLWGNEMKGREQFTTWNSQMVNDHVGMPYDPEVFDAKLRMRMEPVQRPSIGSFASSCLTIAAFHYKPFFDSPTKDQLYRDAMLYVGCSCDRDAYDASLLNGLKAETPYGSNDGLIYSTRDLPSLPRFAQTVAPGRDYSDLDTLLGNRVQKEKSIVIFYDNEPLFNIEGYPKLAGARDEISLDSSYVAMVSCGDYIDGGGIGYMERGKYTVGIMKYAGYDAITLGNHEFNINIDTLRKTLRPIESVITCSNLIEKDSRHTVYAPYIIHQYGSRKVAFLGVTTPESNKLRTVAFLDGNKKKKYELLDDDEFYANVQQNVDKARSEGANYVIVLAHLGLGGTYTKVNTEQLIASTTGIDVVLDSHRDRSENAGTKHLNKQGKPVILSWAADKFRKIGKMVIAPDGVISTELLAIEDLHFNNTPTSLMLDSIQEIFNDIIYEKIGSSSVDILLTNPHVGKGIRFCETNAGDLVADAMRVTTNADISIINSGSIRDELKAGQDITRYDIMQMLPFDNKVVVVNVKGSDIIQLLNDMTLALPTIYSGHLIQQSGLHYTIHEGVGASDIEVLDRRTGFYKPINPDATYSLATIDFCLYEKVYQRSFENAEQISTNSSYAEIMIEYIRDFLGGVIGKEYASPNGRFTVIEKE